MTTIETNAPEGEGEWTLPAPAPRPVELAGSWAEVEELVGARVAELGLTLQAPLPGFEDAANRLPGWVRRAGD